VASTQSALRAKAATDAARPAATSASGCSMLAEAKTCGASPATMRSFSRPDAPNVGLTLIP